MRNVGHTDARRNLVDDLVAKPIEIDRPMDFDALRFWRVRFALLPIARVSPPENALIPEDIRMAASFDKFIEDLNRIIRLKDTVWVG
jgi:hypothetical protein